MRWGHGHTFLSGLAAGVALDFHVALVYGLGVATGTGLVLAGSALAALLRWARRHLEGPDRDDPYRPPTGPDVGGFIEALERRGNPPRGSRVRGPGPFRAWW